jgi:hypothetical protein
MTSTLDNINTNILTRFETVISILDIYTTYKFDDADENIVATYVDTILDLHQNYIMGTINILKDYYQIDKSNANYEVMKKTLYKQFVMAYHSMNIIGDIKRIYTCLKRIEKSYKLTHKDLPELFKRYEYANVDEVYDETNSDICPTCKINYSIDEQTSEFACRECGRTEKMYGVVFEDEQFFYQEGQRTKHGKYDLIKHCRFWVDRIQAKENTDIPHAVINAVKKCIRRDKLWIDNVTCESIRDYLKQLKITNYNNNIPLIRKIITGKEPPTLSDYEIKLIFMYFSSVIPIFNKIKDPSKSNCPYHPYFIYKIVEQILDKPYESNRRKEILSCVHLQSRETLIENDNLWFRICEHMPEFKKRATETRR